MYKDRKNLIIKVNTKNSRIYFNKSAVIFLTEYKFSGIKITTDENQCLIHSGERNFYSYRGSSYVVSTVMVSALKRFFKNISDFDLLILRTPHSNNSFELVPYDESKSPSILGNSEGEFKKDSQERKVTKKKTTASVPYSSITFQISRILRLARNT